MEAKEYLCMIPRNLNKPDKLPIYGRFSVTWKQVGYLAVGGAVAYFTFQTAGLPIVAKIAISTAGFGASLAASFVKPQGVEVDELLFNSLVYAQRKIYYKTLEKEGGLIVTIKSKEEGSTITTKVQKFALQPA